MNLYLRPQGRRNICGSGDERSASSRIKSISKTFCVVCADFSNVFPTLIIPTFIDFLAFRAGLLLLPFAARRLQNDNNFPNLYRPSLNFTFFSPPPQRFQFLCAELICQHIAGHVFYSENMCT